MRLALGVVAYPLNPLNPAVERQVDGSLCGEGQPWLLSETLPINKTKEKKGYWKQLTTVAQAYISNTLEADAGVLSPRPAWATECM